MVTPAPADPVPKYMWTAAAMKKEKAVAGKTLVNNDHPQVN